MKRVFIILIPLFLFEILTFGQVKFKHYGIADGFSDNSVRHIIQDKKGFLWFGTLNGLDRYDGNEIKEYKTEPGNLNSLTYSRILWFMEDSYGYLWLITFNSDFHRFDPRSEKFVNFRSLITDYSKTEAKSQITETSPGIMWIMLRYGGVVRIRESENAQQYSIDIIDTTNLLPGNIVNFVQKDKNGALWIGTNNGLVKFTTDTFKVNKKNSSSKFSVEKGNNFIGYCETGDKIIFATSDSGLFLNNPDKGSSHFQRILLKGRIKSIAKGKANDLLVVTGNDGIYYLSDDANHIVQYKNKEVIGIDSEILDKFLIYVDRKGKFWISARRRGITLFDPVTRKITYFPLNAAQRISQGDDDKHTLFEDSNGDLWIGIYGSGIFKYHREENTFEQFQQQRDNLNSLSTNYVLAIFEDYSKNLWIGTFQGGLNKTELSRYAFNYTHPVKNPKSNTLNEVRSVLADSKNRIWIGTKAGNIYCYNESGAVIYKIPDDLNSKKYEQSNVYSMLEDKDGNFWIGSKGGGLIRIKGLLNAPDMKTANSAVEIFKNDPLDTNSLSNNAVYALYQDNTDQIWIGTYNGGLSLIENPSDKIIFRNFNHNLNDKNSLSDNRVRYIMQDSKGNLWIGTSDGLNLLKENYINTYEKKFIRFRNNLADINSISRNDVYYILEDQQHNIWIATSGGGLNLLHTDQKTGKYYFSYFDRRKGLPGDVVFSISEDTKGNLWLGTDNGLCRFSDNGKEIDSYIAEDGLMDNLFSESACAQTSSGIDIFGQKSGFIRFYPDSVLKEKIIYPIVITDFYLFSKRQQPGNINSPLSTTIEKTTKITLKYNQNYFGFQFSMLDYLHPERCQYAYYLEGEGVDTSWNYVGNKHTATYTNLDPGNYIFHVKASNHEGYWNETPVSIIIHIKPPYWDTIWFRTLVFLMIVAILLGIYFLRINRLRKQKIYLETLVQKRTSEIEEKNKKLIDQTYLLNETNTLLEERQQYIEEQSEELRTQAEELNEKNQNLRTLNMTKDKFFSIIAHDLKNPINAILGFSELLTLKYDVISDEKRKQFIEVIFDSVRNIYKLLENLLQWSRSQTDNMLFKPEKFKLGDLVNNNLELSSNQINEKNLKIVKNISDGVEIFADKNMINTVIRNLITNAVKFTENGDITINIKQIDDSACFEITDTGVGIPEDKINKVFEIDNSKSTEGTKGESGTGLGLIICKEFIEKNGGEIFAKSKENKGSTFGFYIPIKS